MPFWSFTPTTTVKFPKRHRGKDKEELEKLRKQANEIDGMDSPYKAIVSVMMLKEGWDVRNVTTIVGLRPYSARAIFFRNRRWAAVCAGCIPDDVEEYVSVVAPMLLWTLWNPSRPKAWNWNARRWGKAQAPKTPMVIEVDNENEKKDIDELDIEIPVLTPRVYREYKNLDRSGYQRDVGHQRMLYLQFSEEEQREIVFKDITTGEITHTTILDTAGVADYRSVIGYFAQTMMKDLRLVSGYDVLYGKVKVFVQEDLFDHTVDLEDPNTMRNLSELAATKQ